MKLSLEWIQEFVDLSDLSLEELLHKINTSISETEEAVPFLPYLETVVPVKVLSLHKHPQADKLLVAKVSLGDREVQIVTAATNLSVNDIVPLALPGTVLGDKKITSSELRGVMSEGMFCSAKELAISEDDTGVLVLNAYIPANSILGFQSNLLSIDNKPLKLGYSLRKQLGLDDTIIDIDNKSITHRPDLWSHFGFAREIAAQFNRELKFNPLLSTSRIELSQYYQKENRTLSVRETDHALSYNAIPINGVKVFQSTMKFRSRLLKCGLKPISNIVDVSNYLLLECGQPTHFFDRSKLPGDELEVSFAKNGESIPLLDETNPSLTDDILLIRSSGKVVALAGVMGGMETAVFEDTKELVLESAVFRREDVRKTIRRTGIRSDSSIRYEKGLDSSTCIPVIHRALELLQENGNSEFHVGGLVGFTKPEESSPIIRTSLRFLQKKLGKEVSSNIVEDILTRLGFILTLVSESKSDSIEWDVLVPTYRKNYDVTIEEDLVEEIGRTIGYASIDIIPLSLSLVTPIPNELRDLEKRIRSTLSLRLGYHEVFNYSFASPEDARFEGDREDSSIVILKNEMPAEHSVLRTSIYPSILRNVVTNQDRFDSFGLFEIGRTYNNSIRDKDGLPQEDRVMGILYMGQGRTQSENSSKMEEEFIQLRSDLERIFLSWGIDDLSWIKRSKSIFHPHASLELVASNQIIGDLGILHNREADQFGLRKRPIIGMIRLDTLLGILKTKKKNHFRPPSQFPQGYLDISILHDLTEPTEIYSTLLQKSNIDELDEIWVHDRFMGGNLPEGKVSTTYRVSLLSYDKTFTQDRIKQITQILHQVAQDNGYSVR